MVEHIKDVNARLRECPACEQGWVYRVRLCRGEGATPVEGALCEECEALWLKDELINAEDFWQLSGYAEDKSARAHPLHIYTCAYDKKGKCIESEW